MSTKLRALFQAGKPVTGKDLVGREDILNEIKNLLMIGQSVAIIAPRRFGKTSVMLEIMQQFKSMGYFYVYIDIFTTPTRRALAERITGETLKNKKQDLIFYRIKRSFSEILKNLEFRQTVENFDFILKFAEDETDDYQLLEQSIDFVDSFGEKHNRSMICAFDEFGDLTKLDGREIVKLLRAKIQNHQNTAYLFSGSHESVMNELFIEPSSPFYRFVRIINLDMVPLNLFRAHLIEKFNEFDISIEPKIIDGILEFTGGHPYYTQLITQLIELDFLINGKITGSWIDYIDQAVTLENSYIEKVWEELKSSREIVTVILALANDITNIYTSLDNKSINVPRAIRSLKNKGIIRKKNEKYIFNDPLLRYWIRRYILKYDRTECV